MCKRSHASERNLVNLLFYNIGHQSGDFKHDSKQVLLSYYSYYIAVTNGNNGLNVSGHVRAKDPEL